MDKEKIPWLDIKDKVDISENGKYCCPPHNWPHKLLFFLGEKKVTDEPCHYHKSPLRFLHHELGCKYAFKCPNYEYMKSKSGKPIDLNEKTEERKTLDSLIVGGLIGLAAGAVAGITDMDIGAAEHIGVSLVSTITPMVDKSKNPVDYGTGIFSANMFLKIGYLASKAIYGMFK